MFPIFGISAVSRVSNVCEKCFSRKLKWDYFLLCLASPSIMSGLPSTFSIQSYSTYSAPDFLCTDFGGVPGNVTGFPTEIVISLDSFGGAPFYVQ